MFFLPKIHARWSSDQSPGVEFLEVLSWLPNDGKWRNRLVAYRPESGFVFEMQD